MTTTIRKSTKNITVVMSGIAKRSSEFDLKAAYYAQHVPSIGSHYLILADGDVIKGRDHATHGNVHPQFNRDSVYVELMGVEASGITEHQRVALRGVISRLQETYPQAEELDLTN